MEFSHCMNESETATQLPGSEILIGDDESFEPFATVWLSQLK